MRPAFHPRPSILFLVSTLFLVMLLAAACGGTAETDVTIYAGDRWDATIHIEIPTSALGLAGGAAMIEQQFDEFKAEQAANGVKISYESDKASSAEMTAYRFKLSGDSYASMEAAVDIVARPVQVAGKDALSLSYVATGAVSGLEEVIRIHVGSIIDSGGAPTENNTLIGGTGLPIEAIITPKSAFNAWVVIGPLLGVAAIGAVVVIRRKGGPRAPSASPLPHEALARSGIGLENSDTSPAQAEKQTLDCPSCGKETLAWSKFCMNCGAQLPSLDNPQA